MPNYGSSISGRSCASHLPDLSRCVERQSCNIIKTNESTPLGRYPYRLATQQEGPKITTQRFLFEIAPC